MVLSDALALRLAVGRTNWGEKPMATEFIETDQNTTYVVDDWDTVFLLDDVVFTLSNEAAFEFAEVGGFTNGNIILSLSGDIYGQGEIMSETFTADVDSFALARVSAVITETSNIVLQGDAFHLQATDPNVIYSAASITNAGSITSNEAVLHAWGFDEILFTNTGTILQTTFLNAGGGGVFSSFGDASTIEISNSGTITSSHYGWIMSDILSSEAELSILNSGTINAQGGSAIFISGSGSFFEFGNTGDVFGDFVSSAENDFANDGNYYGSVDLDGSSNFLLNNGLMSDEVSFGGEGTAYNTGEILADLVMSEFSDEVANEGSILGEVLLQSGEDTYIGSGTVQLGIYGGDGDDTIVTSDASDFVNGGNDDDLIRTQDGDDGIFEIVILSLKQS